MPIKKAKKKKYRAFFRISSLWEVVEDNDVVLNITAEILPRYPSGLPEEADPNLTKELSRIYEENKDYLVNKAGIIIKKLAIEVMVLSDRPKRSEKLKDLKLVLLDEEFAYSEDHYMLEITLKFKPLMKPVFEADFYHSGIVYQEELKKENMVVPAKVVQRKIRRKRKKVSPVFKIINGRKRNA